MAQSRPNQSPTCFPCLTGTLQGIYNFSTPDAPVGRSSNPRRSAVSKVKFPFRGTGNYEHLNRDADFAIREELSAKQRKSCRPSNLSSDVA